MIPVSFIISCSLASISACLEFVEQLLMLIPARSKFRRTLVGVPLGCRGTVNIYKVDSQKKSDKVIFQLDVGVLDNEG